jgi:hypothetical protein
MSIVLVGSTSGSVTLQEPAVAGTTVLDLPATSGTMALTSQLPVAGPSFSAYLNSSQTLSSATITKITFDAELWDTNNNFASSRFTPTVAGYYQINALINVNTTGCRVYLAIYKNGSVYQTGPDSGLANVYAEGISSIVFCNGTTDYIEIYGQFGVGQAVSASNLYTWFNGALIRVA